jgi:hypothetical protein
MADIEPQLKVSLDFPGFVGYQGTFDASLPPTQFV